MKGIQKQVDKSARQGRTQGINKAYQKRFCSVVLNQGRQGKSLTQIAAYLGVTRKRLYSWMKDHPEFKDAVEMAREHSQAWWENKAQKSLDSKHFQGSMLGKMMASRFPDDYGERSSIEIEAPITVIRRVIVSPNGIERPSVARAIEHSRVIEHKRSDDKR